MTKRTAKKISKCAVEVVPEAKREIKNYLPVAVYILITAIFFYWLITFILEH